VPKITTSSKVDC